MTQNYQVIPPIELMTSRYFVRTADGTQKEDEETREIVRRKFTYLINFLHSENLLKDVQYANDGKLVDKAYFKDDFTEDGLMLVTSKMAGWLDSKGSDSNPPKMTILERELKNIRSK